MDIKIMDDLSSMIALAQISVLTLPKKYALLKHFNNVEEVLDLDTDDIKFKSLKLNGCLRKHVDKQKLEHTQKWLAASPLHHIVSIVDKSYPMLLKQIHTPPLLLYLLGDPKLLDTQQLAIVGSRKATCAGKQTAYKFAGELAMSGLTINSGMALGIDASAHSGALSHYGKTIAVLGTGVDRCYPQANRALYQQIAEQGLIISEFCLGSAPRKQHFPRRNRLISGLSLGVLVVEATQRSGSLITAKHALQQNREVFAIPGSIHAVTSSGCLGLIQQGAKLTRSAQDIFEEFREFSALAINNGLKLSDNQLHSNSSECEGILKYINDAPVSFDKLISQSGLTIDQLCSILLDLELDGRLEKLPGNQFIKTAKVKIN